MYVNNLLRKKGLETLKKNRILSIPSWFFTVKAFLVVNYSTAANQLSKEQ